MVMRFGKIFKIFSEKFKEKGHDNVHAFVIPKSFSKKKIISKVCPETLVATQGGNQKIEDHLFVRQVKYYFVITTPK